MFNNLKYCLPKSESILVVVHDDKFIDFIYNLFEDHNNGLNDFIVLGKKKPLKYIKYTPVRFVPLLSMYFANSRLRVKKYKAIVFYGLNDRYKVKFLQSLKAESLIIWLGIGEDYYSLLGSEYVSLLKPKTKEIQRKIGAKRKSFKERIFQILFYKGIDKVSLIHKFDYFAPVVPNELFLIRRSLPSFNAKYIDWASGYLEYLFKGLEGVSITGNSILIGNSATYTNNHIEAFDKIKSTNMSFDKIICPLSYGVKEYGEYVMKKGFQMFGNKFWPLDRFLPTREYIKVLSECSICVMNHIRQQAYGNVVIMTYLGAKVFLDHLNPIYQYFKDEGIRIFKLDELGKESIDPFSSDEVEENRFILRKLLSKNAVEIKIKKLLNVINIHSNNSLQK